MRALRTDACPFDPPPPTGVPARRHLGRPGADGATVEIAEFTNEGLVRHASFIELDP